MKIYPFGRSDHKTGTGNRINSVLQRKISVPLVLFIILFLGAIAGISLLVQNMALQQKIAGLEVESAQFDKIQSLKMSNEWLRNRVAVLQEEKATLLDNAVADLSQKTKVIESILSSVGVDIPIQESTENSGGPFTRYGLETKDNLILQTDKYLDTLLNVPLGAPIPGVITSKFGKRLDPINGEPAYHRGVDIRGRMGSKVKATAGGTVLVQSYNKSRGRYILLDHGNGFRTRYCHLKKSLVHKGDTVKRGQAIGLVGSSGRSTGPHVHYEIHYNNKIVNPIRFVRVAKYLNKGNKRI
ncbi:MAG: peptidoglycan DD-metalloendopeptidase family protein [Desulfobulbales bacterium]